MAQAVRAITRLQDADDIDFASPVDGFALAWNSAASKFEPGSTLRGNGIAVAVASPTYVVDLYDAVSADDVVQHGLQFILENSGDVTSAYRGDDGLHIQHTISGTVRNGKTAAPIGMNIRVVFSGSTSGTGESISSYGAQIVSNFAGTIVGTSELVKIFGANIASTGDMGTAANTRHEGLLVSATGTAQQNYALRISVVTGGNVNYGIYITGPSVDAATSWTIYSPYAAKGWHAGKFGFGTGANSPAGQMDVRQGSSTGALPVLRLAQSDVSEEFLRLVGVSAADASQSLVDAADRPTPGAIVGWMKVYVQDDAASGAITDGIYYVPFYAAPTA